MSDKESMPSILENLNIELQRLDERSAIQFMLSMIDADGTHPIMKSMLINGAARYLNNSLLHETATSHKPIIYSPVDLPVGIISYDGSAILGYEGFIFLIGGSNDVLAQYSYSDMAHLVEAWDKLLGIRQQEASKRALRLHHVIVPEKISLIPELFPRPISAPTHLLERLETEVFSKRKSSYTSGRSALWDGSKVSCKKMDSHLSPAGTFRLFTSLISDIFDCETDYPSFCLTTAAIGDLCYRMFGFHVKESYKEAETPKLHLPTKLHETKPAEGSHNGFCQRWSNSHPVIDKRVMVFGNSYCSTVEYGQSTMSWWFARYFSEYTFFWTNEVLWEEVDKYQPDAVIWQGVERFLPVVPGS